MSMDIQENPTKVPLSENAILHQSGVSFFRIFTAYRKEKKIRTEKIVSGVISRRAFLDIEKGKSVLSRENWKDKEARNEYLEEYCYQLEDFVASELAGMF